MRPWKRNFARSVSTILLRALFSRNRLGCRILELIRGEWRWLQTELLKRQLKSYGPNCSFNFPLRIEGAEHIKLGERVSMSPFIHIWGQGGIEIGDNTMIASHTAITSITHNKNSLLFNEENVALPVKIGKNVWIGSHVVILPGIEIGDDSIIGAGAIVTRNVPSKTTVIGIPARPMIDINYNVV